MRVPAGNHPTELLSAFEPMTGMIGKTTAPDSSTREIRMIERSRSDPLLIRPPCSSFRLSPIPADSVVVVELDSGF